MKFLALQIVVGPIFEGEGEEREHKKKRCYVYNIFTTFLQQITGG